LGPQNKDHVNTSHKRLICNRLQSSKLIEIWVVIAFEAKRRDTNVVHISNENTFTNFKTVKIVSLVAYYVKWSGWKKRIFNSPKRIFSIPPYTVDRLNQNNFSKIFSSFWDLEIRTMLIYQTRDLYVTNYIRVS
jgi:GH18 family chitinase